jgi:DNA-binding transcriptional ArsR family regulator
MKTDKKEIILRVLRESPEGATIQEISDKGKMSRITATIYIHELLGEGVITERKIGAYRLFYLKEKFLENVSSKEVIDKLKEKMK